MPYEEPIRRDSSSTECYKTTKMNWAEKAKEPARKSSTQGRKVPLKKNNHEKELGKKLFKKAKVKAINGRICRERSNNAKLKRTEKRKQ